MEIIQEIISGIPECPRLFESEKDALKSFIKLAKAGGVEYDFEEVEKRYDQHDSDAVSKFIEDVKEQLEGGDYELYWWISNVKSNSFV
jgi:hypothetical protein